MIVIFALGNNGRCDDETKFSLLNTTYKVSEMSKKNLYLC